MSVEFHIYLLGNLGKGLGPVLIGDLVAGLLMPNGNPLFGGLVVATRRVVVGRLVVVVVVVVVVLVVLDGFWSRMTSLGTGLMFWTSSSPS